MLSHKFKAAGYDFTINLSRIIVQEWRAERFQRRKVYPCYHSFAFSAKLRIFSSLKEKGCDFFGKAIHQPFSDRGVGSEYIAVVDLAAFLSSAGSGLLLHIQESFIFRMCERQFVGCDLDISVSPEVSCSGMSDALDLACLQFEHFPSLCLEGFLYESFADSHYSKSISILQPSQPPKRDISGTRL